MIQAYTTLTDGMNELPETLPPVTSESRMFALLSYASMFTGIPLFVIPLIQKTDSFAMYHARHAAIAYLEGLVLGMCFVFLSVVTCGFGWCLFPILFLAMVPAVHGAVLAINDQRQEPFGTFGLAEKLFGPLK